MICSVQLLQMDPDKRAAFLDEACVGDEVLRKEVETLLDSDKKKTACIEVTRDAVSCRICWQSRPRPD